MASNKRIGDICEILNGFAFKSDEYAEDGIRVMRITNVQKGQVVDDDPKFFPAERKREIEKYLLRGGDLLMSLTGNVGRVGLLPEAYLPAALNQRVACLRIKSESVLMDFLFHALNSNNFEEDCIFNASGIAQKNMSTRWLEDYTISVPSITDQERIVAELNLLTGILDKQRAQLKELDTLAQSIFYDMFGTTIENDKGWQIKALGAVGTFQRGGGFLKSDYVEDGCPCLHYGQIHTKLGVATYQHLTCIPEDLAITKSKFAQTGDVILAITSEDVEGSCKCTAWMGNYPIAVGGHTAIFHSTLNPIYAVYYFKSDYFQKAKERYAHGFKVVEIKPTDIASIKVCIPPEELQTVFASQIEAIEHEKTMINQSIVETQKLFDYTMDKYFG